MTLAAADDDAMMLCYTVIDHGDYISHVCMYVCVMKLMLAVGDDLAMEKHSLISSQSTPSASSLIPNPFFGRNY